MYGVCALCVSVCVVSVYGVCVCVECVSVCVACVCVSSVCPCAVCVSVCSGCMFPLGLQLRNSGIMPGTGLTPIPHCALVAFRATAENAEHSWGDGTALTPTGSDMLMFSPDSHLSLPGD